MPRSDIDRLLQHAGWVRALAGRLVNDPGLADDLVQETWIRALRSGPSEIRSPRAWLATLLLRRLREAQRSERRRARHEGLSHHGHESATTDERVERAEDHRLLEQAVLALREPFRTAVLMRYLEELAPGEIAARLGVPEPTVHSRLARGLASLRVRLDAQRRERNRGLLLAPGRWWDRPAARRSARALQASALAAGLCFLGVLLWSVASALAEPEREAPRVARAGSVHGAAVLAERADGASGLAPLVLREEARALPPDVETARLARPRSRGRVLDCDGRGVGGATVAVVAPRNEEERALSAISAADGSFELARAAAPVWLGVSDERHVTVLEARLDPRRDAEATLFVAPRLEVKGHLRDQNGVAIPQAEIFVDVGTPSVTFDRPLYFNRLVSASVRTDARGAFQFAGVPNLPTTHLRVRTSGKLSVPMDVREEYAGHMFIRIDRPTGARILRGRVTNARGEGVPAALVSAYPNCTSSDAAGDFALVLLSEPRGADLVALAPSLGASAIPLEHDAGGRVEAGAFVELRLPERAQTIEGRVLDATGRPAAGALVWIADPTLVQQAAEGPLGAESLCADALPAPWSRLVTDQAGRFRLQGLLERAYHVRAADPRTLVCTEARVRAGEPAELVLPGEERLASVRGRVVDSRGLPVADVSVTATRLALEPSPQDAALPQELATAPVTTDAQGRFELPPCAREGTILRLESERILPAHFELCTPAPGEELELPVRFVSFLGVRLAQPWTRADSIEIVDASGERTAPYVLEQCKVHASARSGLADGRSAILTVPDTTSEVVLLLQGREVARLPVVQRPGELSLLSW